MFNLFRKKPVSQDVTETVAAIAAFLVDDTGSDLPTPKKEFLDPLKLDYSIDSLLHVDAYLDKVRKGLKNLSDEQYSKVVLRCGAYCGEVVRKLSVKKRYWITYDTAVTIDSRIESFGKSPFTFYLLFAEPNDFSFPMGKVMKYIENGPEDSLHALAQVLLSDNS